MANSDFKLPMQVGLNRYGGQNGDKKQTADEIPAERRRECAEVVRGTRSDPAHPLPFRNPVGVLRLLPRSVLTAPAVLYPVSADLSHASSIYLCPDSAQSGPVDSLLAQGVWAATFREVAQVYGARSVMEADGLQLNGNILRWTAANGPFTKFTFAATLTRVGDPSRIAGEIFAATTNVGRIAVVYTPDCYVITTPAIPHAVRQGGYGDTQTIAFEMMADSFRLIEPDGFEVILAAAHMPTTLLRVELGRPANAKIHELAFISEV